MAPPTAGLSDPISDVASGLVVDHAFNAVPGIAGRMPRPVPPHVRRTSGTVPVAGQVRLGLVPGPVGHPAPRLPAVAVRRRVLVVARAGFHVGAGAVVLPPVGGFNRGGDRLGGPLAPQAPRHGTNHRPDSGARRPRRPPNPPAA